MKKGNLMHNNSLQDETDRKLNKIRKKLFLLLSALRIGSKSLTNKIVKDLNIPFINELFCELDSKRVEIKLKNEIEDRTIFYSENFTFELSYIYVSKDKHHKSDYCTIFSKIARKNITEIAFVNSHTLGNTLGVENIWGRNGIAAVFIVSILQSFSKEKQKSEYLIKELLKEGNINA
jgi:hypothetical protein